MDSIKIEVYPYLSTSFDVKVMNKGRESWFVVHTDEGLIIEGDCTNQEREAIEAIFNNR
jgi:hypothetical protein